MFNSAMAQSIFPLNTDWPFSAERAKQLQEKTAAALDIPVELKIEISEDMDIVFILIPAGEFLMGTPQSEIIPIMNAEKERSMDDFIRSEGSQRRVRITRPFYMGKHEITYGQWHAVMEKHLSQGKDIHELSNTPVVNISWQEIHEPAGFVGMLNRRSETVPFEHAVFRLPTEAEWEYACRAGASDYYAGGATLETMGWFAGNSEGSTQPVGSKKSNAWGLYDMHGNAAEWCSDWYDRYFYTQWGNWIDPAGAPKGKERVIRGGSWRHNSTHCRSASRNSASPESKHSHVGFRIVLSIHPPEVVVTQYRPAPGIDVDSDEMVAYVFDELKYIGTLGAIDRVSHANNAFYRDRSYDNLVSWRNSILNVTIVPADSTAGNQLKVRREERIPESHAADHQRQEFTRRILSEQIRLKQQATDYSRDDMIDYLEEILPHWENHSGRNAILLLLAGLHSDDTEKSFKYYKRVATDRSAPPADRWGMDIQEAWKAIARIYEAQEEYGKAIEAVSNWHVSEPCGTGAGGSMVERWTWLLRLRVKNGENIDELKEYAWQSLRTGKLESIWHPVGVADCLIELYQNNYDALLADAHKTLAMLEDEENDEDRKRWRREEVMNVLNHISLRMRLAGPEWRMTTEEAKDRQKKQADSFLLPIEKTVMFGEVPMAFMFIPAGEFLIGSPPDETGRIPPDEDRDRVRISRPFFMGKYEVTQLQWQNVMGSNPSRFKDNPDSAMRPVDSVSWNDIVELFLPRIQQYAPSGMRFDLPTEAQWEYACRAGADTPFHFGETPDHNSANIGEIIEKYTGRWETMPVGSFPSNAWGLYDMHGNVQEWCKDTFSHRYFRSHNAVAVDPVNKGGRGRVIRGGGYSYSSRAERSRSACRLNDTPDRRVAGLRLVLLTHEGNKNDTEQKDALDDE